MEREEEFFCNCSGLCTICHFCRSELSKMDVSDTLGQGGVSNMLGCSRGSVWLSESLGKA